MILVIDTETAGLPRSWSAAKSDLANWPRVVEVAYATFDFLGQPRKVRRWIVRPDGFEIPAEASRVHGITQELALREGTPLAEVLDVIGAALAWAQVVVMHNVEFDEPVLGAEFERAGRMRPFSGKTMICTMRAGTELCKLPGKGRGYKFPRLAELHQYLFGRLPEETLHGAAADVAVTSRCYFELRRRGVVK